MKHLITTRIKFDNDILMMKYLEVSKKTFFPSVLSQINKNFILIDEFFVLVPGKHESGSTFLNNLATIPGFQIENLTCARNSGFNNILEA